MKTTFAVLLLCIALPVAGQDKPRTVVPGQRVPVDEIRHFAQVFAAVRENYVDVLSDEEIMQAGLRGLLLDIDPHSAYLSAKQAQSFDDLSAGAYGGIGIESDERDPTRIRVVAPFDDTPAQRAGLRAGDYITAINGVPVNNQDGHASPEQLRGKPGTKAVLTVLRQGEKSPLTLTVVRDVISIQSVKARWLEPGFAYFRISAFQGDTGSELRRQWQRLQSIAPEVHVRGVVLDLRSNPGGLVTAAVEVADAFLSEGIVVRTRGRNTLANSTYYSKPGEQFAGVPVAVLIDAGSASASEILAGALQDHKRATIMGSRSFGKGSVQNVIHLDNGDAIKLTTARYYTPNDRSIQALGIVPDLLLAGNARAQIIESGLPKHIKAGSIAEADAESGVVLLGEAYIDKALAYLKQGLPKP